MGDQTGAAYSKFVRTSDVNVRILAALGRLVEIITAYCVPFPLLANSTICIRMKCLAQSCI